MDGMLLGNAQADWQHVVSVVAASLQRTIARIGILQRKLTARLDKLVDGHIIPAKARRYRIKLSSGSIEKREPEKIRRPRNWIRSWNWIRVGPRHTPGGQDCLITTPPTSLHWRKSFISSLRDWILAQSSARNLCRGKFSWVYYLIHRTSGWSESLAVDSGVSWLKPAVGRRWQRVFGSLSRL